MLDDDDYDIDFYTVEPIHPEATEPQNPMPSPRLQLEVLSRHVACLTEANVYNSFWFVQLIWRESATTNIIARDIIAQRIH